MRLAVSLLLGHLLRAESRLQRNSWSQDLGNVSYVQYGLANTLADYVTQLGAAVEPAWKANVTAELASAGGAHRGPQSWAPPPRSALTDASTVTIVGTERIIIVPNVIIFPPVTALTALPRSGADWARFLANMALFDATGTTVFPFALWNRLQFYWASDLVAGIQMPGTTGGVGGIGGLAGNGGIL